MTAKLLINRSVVARTNMINKLWSPIGLCALIGLVSSVNAQTTVVWQQDFEGPTPGWSVDGGTWEIGIPISGPNGAHSGDRCAATVLAGNYVDSGSTRLISPEFLV